MKIRLLCVLSIALAGLVSTSCSDYQKLLNGDDTAEKYKQAEVYYNNGEYRKANRLLEQIIPKYRGKPQAQRIIFFFAESYFQTKSYLLAAYQFENFIKSYPKSDRVQEASFKNQMIAELQEKLEQKDFEIAKQYHTIRDYKAAIKANENFVSSFPGTKFREESLYTKFIASYEIAVNSVDSKKKERLEELIQQYNTIVRYYPESLFLEDLDKRMTKVNEDLDQLNQDSSQQTK